MSEIRRLLEDEKLSYLIPFAIAVGAQDLDESLDSDASSFLESDDNPVKAALNLVMAVMNDDGDDPGVLLVVVAAAFMEFFAAFPAIRSTAVERFLMRFGLDDASDVS